MSRDTQFPLKHPPYGQRFHSVEPLPVSSPPVLLPPQVDLPLLHALHRHPTDVAVEDLVTQSSGVCVNVVRLGSGDLLQRRLLGGVAPDEEGHDGGGGGQAGVVPP